MDPSPLGRRNGAVAQPGQHVRRTAPECASPFARARSAHVAQRPHRPPSEGLVGPNAGLVITTEEGHTVADDWHRRRRDLHRRADRGPPLDCGVRQAGAVRRATRRRRLYARRGTRAAHRRRCWSASDRCRAQFEIRPNLGASGSVDRASWCLSEGCSLRSTGHPAATSPYSQSRSGRCGP